jgi:putative transposase
MHTMTKRQGKSGTIDVKALLAEDEEFLRALVRTALQEVLEAEMTEALSAEKGVSSQEGAEAAITPVNKRDNHSNS